MKVDDYISLSELKIIITQHAQEGYVQIKFNAF